MIWVRQDPHVSSFLYITVTRPHEDPPTSLTFVFLAQMCDWSGAYRTGDCCPPCSSTAGSYGWVVRETAPEVRWATLRAWVSSFQKLQPCGRGGAMDPGLRKWAQPDKTQGNKQRISFGTCATWLESNMDLQPCEALQENNRLGQRNLRIPTIANRSGTPGSRSCKFATSAYRPKCRVRRDPSHHSGRQH